MKKFLIITSLLSAILFFVSCSNKGNTEALTKDEEHMNEHASENTAVLSMEQIKSIGIEFGNIEEKQLTAALKTNGVLKVPNQNKAKVNSIYSGVIKSLLVQPGNMVRKGQIVATISNPEFIHAQSQYLSVMTKISFAELEVKRQKELNEGNAGAMKNLQASEAELRNLRTLKSTLEQQIQLMGIKPSQLSNGKLISVLTVKSPINGVVSNVTVEMGSYVDLTTTIVEIVDNRQLHLDLFVYEKDLSKLMNNQTIHFTVTNNPGKEYDAQIFSLGSSFEGESKAVSVHAMVKGDKAGLIDGMNVTAIVSLNRKNVPAVPNEAIVRVDGQDYIFALNETVEKDSLKPALKMDVKELTFERIPIAKGTTDIGYTEITPIKEIPKGTKIVTKGAFFVSAKMTNTEGHED